MKPLLYIGLFIGVIAIIFTAVLFTAYPLKYKKEIKEASELYNVNPVLIASVINAESGFRSNAVSNKGAVGLMQIMPSTAEWIAQQLNLDLTPTDSGDNNENSNTDVITTALKNPSTNILIGTYYLKYLLEKFKDEKTALIAYNAGEGKVMTWLTDGRFSANAEGYSVLTSSPYSVTNKYVEKVLNGENFYKIRF